jgi:hypothetical protein
MQLYGTENIPGSSNFKIHFKNTQGQSMQNEGVWGSWVIAPPFVTSGLDGGEWSIPRPCHFIPGEKNTQYPLIRRLGEPQGQYGRYGEKKDSLPLPRIEPRLLGRKARSLVAIPTEPSLFPESIYMYVCIIRLILITKY